MHFGTDMFLNGFEQYGRELVDPPLCARPYMVALPQRVISPCGPLLAFCSFFRPIRPTAICKARTRETLMGISPAEHDCQSEPAAR